MSEKARERLLYLISPIALLAIWQVRNRRVWVLAGLALFTIALAQGEHGLVYPVLRKVVPQIGFMRFPIKFVVLSTLIIPLLAAHAVAWFQSLPSTAWKRQWKLPAGLTVALAVLIGILLLIGIVKKNAIMMVDFALEAERDYGKPPREAIYEACLLRFRPILMTTLAALFGALPLMLGMGTGSELRRPLGISIVGGLLLSQVLTLFTTPVIYLALDRLGRRISPRRAETPQE